VERLQQFVEISKECSIIIVIIGQKLQHRYKTLSTYKYAKGNSEEKNKLCKTE